MIYPHRVTKKQRCLLHRDLLGGTNMSTGRSDDYQRGVRRVLRRDSIGSQYHVHDVNRHRPVNAKALG